MQRIQSRPFARAAATAALMTAFIMPLAGSACARTAAPAPDAPAPSAPSTKAEQADMIKQLQLFGEVFDRTREQYVDAVPNKELIENALNGMLSALDPHSGFLNKKDFDDMKVQTRGEFGGLGIEVTLDDNKLIKIISPIDDTPAAKAGIQPGDLITHIDNKLVTEMTLNEAIDKMRGKPGTDVMLTIRRGALTSPPLDVKLKRDIIKIVSVRSRVIDDVGYIRITTFNEQTQSGVEKALKDINSKVANSKLSGYVLDLRNNPGGLLEQSIDVAGDFLPDGAEVVSTRGRTPQDSSRFFGKGGDRTGNKPMVVLINSGSASAAEIVSGALQDYKRAIVLGTKSFGKGSVQTIIPVNEEAAIRLTTARYYTPSGRSIQGLGIEPDIKVEPVKFESVNEDTKTVRESDLRGALKNDQLKKDKAEEPAPGETKPAAPKENEGTAPSQKLENGGLGKDEDATKDYQLMRAIDLLRGISIYGQRASAPAATTTAATGTTAAATAH